MFTLADQRGMFFEGDGIMELLREYLLSVSVAAMVCGMAGRLLDRKGTPAAMGKLLAGLFMTFTVLSPLAGVSVGPMEDISNEFQDEAQLAVKAGERYVNSALREGITNRTEEYILDKASSLGANIRVQIVLSDDVYPAPYKVYVSGDISPFAKSQLKQVISQLGVAEENQIWT